MASTTKTATRARAPKGGVTVGGKFYRGGQFLPAGVSVPVAPAPKTTRVRKPAPKKATRAALLAAAVRAEKALALAARRNPLGGMKVIAARQRYEAAYAALALAC